MSTVMIPSLLILSHPRSSSKLSKSPSLSKGNKRSQRLGENPVKKIINNLQLNSKSTTLLNKAAYTVKLPQCKMEVRLFQIIENRMIRSVQVANNTLLTARMVSIINSHLPLTKISSSRNLFTYLLRRNIPANRLTH
jgi:hypothetical protein